MKVISISVTMILIMLYRREKVKKIRHKIKMSQVIPRKRSVKP
jgi:hypothetical protein